MAAAQNHHHETDQQRTIRPMMASVYATLLIAFILDLSGLRRWAVTCLFLSLALCVWLFLWKIYSPDYGFRMPWLQVDQAPIFAPLRSS
jgi:Mn2+/Fe2+ NRAMP family transporter